MRRLDVAGIVPYVVILLISCFLYYQAGLITSAGEGRLGADFWPKSILVVAMLTCLWEIARKIGVGARRDSRPSATAVTSADTALMPPGRHMDDEPEVGPFVPWIGIGLTVAYVLSMPSLGYFLASCLFVTAFVYTGNFRKPLVAAYVGIAASLSFLFLFMRVVYVSLPLGVEPFSYLSTFIVRVMGVK
jgi:putative tricarboxylic transport membrane protein